MTTAAEHLAKHNIRPSVQRVAIMQYLLDHRTHPTVDAIFSDLVKTMPTLSRTTVYNTLQLLIENHAALGLNIDAHNMHFDGYTHPHAHFICRNCGKIYDIDIDSHLHDHLFSSDKFKIENVELNYAGICPECNKSGNDEM